MPRQAPRRRKEAWASFFTQLRKPRYRSLISAATPACSWLRGAKGEDFNMAVLPATIHTHTHTQFLRMKSVQEVLNAAEIDGKIVRITGQQLDRKVYEGVKKAIEGIGGKWKGGKTQGFEFTHDPTDLLAKLQSGDRVNLKKEFQFFPTPKAVATTLCRFAGVETATRILEPSAGQGAIVDVIRLLNQTARIDCYELMEQNQKILAKRVHLNLVGEDFLQSRPQPIYDCIVANPPFTKNQDIDHVQHMYKFLAPGGKLASVMSKHFTFSENRKETDFLEWLEELGAEIMTLPAGTFKESGTMIETVLVAITKKS